jgi:hypothetical protein
VTHHMQITGPSADSIGPELGPPFQPTSLRSWLRWRP